MVELGLLVAGSTWTYRHVPGFEDSRLVIGALVRFEAGRDIACVSITGAPQRDHDGALVARDIPLLPMTVEALRATVVAQASPVAVPAGFADAFEAWQDDARGSTFFTVPFEGHLDRMIARQMADLALARPA
jgi:hypothetical protein